MFRPLRREFATKMHTHACPNCLLPTFGNNRQTPLPKKGRQRERALRRYCGVCRRIIDKGSP